MKNLKELAKKFNLYTLQDIPAEWQEALERKNEYFFKTKIPEFFKDSKFECDIFFLCQIQDKGTDNEIYYVENSYILLNGNGNLLMLHSNKNKFRFHPYYGLTHKFSNISHYIKNQKLKELKEPNYIGVFSDKKISDWVNYCDFYLKVLESLLETTSDKNAQIEQEIKDFIDSLPTKKVSQYNGSYYIDVPNFYIQLIHNKSECYLTKKIDFRGDLKTVQKICLALS